MPPGFTKNIHEFDPCLSSPCLFGKMCKTTSETSFICFNEIDATKEISDARLIYRNMEMLSKHAIQLNLDTIMNGGNIPMPAVMQQQMHEEQNVKSPTPIARKVNNLNSNEAMFNLKGSSILNLFETQIKQTEI